METQMKLQDLIKAAGITMTVKRVKSNLNADGWDSDARHFLTVLKMGNRKMRVYFSQGTAHTSDPTAADVLDCLASDASGLENAQSFEDWCAEYGYDTDSRKAYKTYTATESQTERLKAFMGLRYQDLIWNTEKL